MLDYTLPAEKIAELLNDADLQGTDLVAEGKHRDEGIAILEAPRGTLIHDYSTDENGLITRANMIVGTTHNLGPIIMLARVIRPFSSVE